MNLCRLWRGVLFGRGDAITIDITPFLVFLVV